jgi:hypothetical protein
LDELVRGVKLPDGYEVPHSFLKSWKSDSESNGKRGGKTAEGYECYGFASHVLLAACKTEENAREADRRGLFTSALLKVLRDIYSHNTYSYSITYKDLIESIGVIGEK